LATVTDLVGKLLVAPPHLSDPNFTESVVVILLHNDEGAFGLVLNRTSGLDADTIVPAWADVADGPIRSGGPVATDSLLAVARVEGLAPDGYQPVETSSLGPLGIVDLHRDPDPTLRDVRIFAGYTGWGPGQLDGEILMGGWLVVPGLPSDPFDLRLDAMWGAVLRRSNPSDPVARLLPDSIDDN
jgi:putative transcriptional regulator